MRVMTDTLLDESETENTDCTPYMTWEEADQNDEQLQSEQSINLDHLSRDEQRDTHTTYSLTDTPIHIHFPLCLTHF